MCDNANAYINYISNLIFVKLINGECTVRSLKTCFVNNQSNKNDLNVG